MLTKETAERLKEAGFRFRQGQNHALYEPTLKELLDELPSSIKTKDRLYNFHIYKQSNLYVFIYADDGWDELLVRFMLNDTDEAVAKTWLWLKENGYLEGKGGESEKSNG